MNLRATVSFARQCSLSVDAGRKLLTNPRTVKTVGPSAATGGPVARHAMRRARVFRVLVAGLLLGQSQALFADSSQREICIGALSGNPGGRATVPLTLDNGDGVAAFQIDFRFDTSLLSLVAVRPGPDL